MDIFTAERLTWYAAAFSCGFVIQLISKEGGIMKFLVTGGAGYIGSITMAAS